MHKNYTVNEMSDMLIELGKRKYSDEHQRLGLQYCFAFGTMTALFQHSLYGFSSVQEIVNSKCIELEKELATL